MWVAPLDVPPEVLAALAASMAPSERARAERSRDATTARRFCTARGWLRHVLGAATATAPADVRLVDGPGKPRLEGPAGLSFNLAHAGELALVAVADREVGVDLEHVDSGPGGLEAVGLACSPAEARALAGLAPAARPTAFLRLWTAKEAYLKGIGVGLAVAPATIGVGRADDAGFRPVHVDGGAGSERWYVRELQPAPGHVGAVAAEGRAWDVALRGAAAIGPTSSVDGGMDRRRGRT